MVRGVLHALVCTVCCASGICIVSGCNGPGAVSTAPLSSATSAPSPGHAVNEEIAQQLSLLPPQFRQEFDTPHGHEQLALMSEDRRLLVAEARRQGLADSPRIREQVRDLEAALLVQRLADEQVSAAGPATETELRTFFEAHRDELKRDGRVPSFQEVRGEVAERFAPARRRQLLENLVVRLERDADVHIHE